MSQEISLTSDGSQAFSITLDEVVYEFNVIYNTRLNVWSASISVNGEYIANGIILVGGIDLLQQLTLELQNLFTININNPALDAGPDNLGTDVKLFKFSNDEVLASG